jgi:hypothetical protein
MAHIELPEGLLIAAAFCMYNRMRTGLRLADRGDAASTAKLVRA